MVDAPELDGVHQLVAWIPMLDSDERPAAVEASRLFAGAPVRQFWDGERRLGAEVGRSLGLPRWIAWDVYLFYGPDAEWQGGGLPPPDAALAQASSDRGGGVVATRGTLPPRGDQSVLPSWLEGRAVLAGSYGELSRLLAEAARRFAARR